MTTRSCSAAVGESLVHVKPSKCFSCSEQISLLNHRLMGDREQNECVVLYLLQEITQTLMRRNEGHYRSPAVMETKID